MLEPDGGTLIHGTGRQEDLIPCFLDELERLRDEGPLEDIRDKHSEVISAIEQSDEVPPGLEEEAIELQIELEDALDEYAQKFGYQFRGLEGDPSDMGFWPID